MSLPRTPAAPLPVNGETMNTAQAKRVLETALICSQQPLPVREMRELFSDMLGLDTIKQLLDQLTTTLPVPTEMPEDMAALVAALDEDKG